MDEENPVRQALAAVGVSGKKVTGLPDEHHTFSDIEVTIEHSATPCIHMEYEDSAGAYHHRRFEIDMETMQAEDSDDLILRPQRRTGDPFVTFFEENGPFDVRR